MEFQEGGTFRQDYSNPDAGTVLHVPTTESNESILTQL